MTLSQLRTFALVARLGSMRAAAEVLGVSEPAVSAAIAALRSDLGDALVVRAEGGVALTPGGRRLAAHADEIVGLADRARREVAAAGSAADLLRVAVTAAFEEHAADALVDAFTRRSPGVSVEVLRERPSRLAAALAERAADLALGIRPASGSRLDVVPFLRYQRVVVAAPGTSEITGQRWLAGPHGVEELSQEAGWFGASVPDAAVDRLPTEGEALGRVLAGEGVMLALAHVVREHLRDGSLVRLPVAGTPVPGLWCAATLADGRAPAAARALQRFATTPDATAAMVATGGIPRQARSAATVKVSLWS